MGISQSQGNPGPRWQRQVADGVSLEHLSRLHPQAASLRQGRSLAVDHQEAGFRVLIRQTPQGQPAEFPSP
jgi:hypothetical protein